MTLHEIIQSLESHPEGATIFAERINGEFRPESRAVLIEMTDDELLMPVQDVAASRAPGADYFLEISVDREVVEGWKENRRLPEITLDELTEVMIHYANNDAWPMGDAE